MEFHTMVGRGDYGYSEYKGVVKYIVKNPTLHQHNLSIRLRLGKVSKNNKKKLVEFSTKGDGSIFH